MKVPYLTAIEVADRLRDQADTLREPPAPRSLDAALMDEAADTIDGLLKQAFFSITKPRFLKRLGL